MADENHHSAIVVVDRFIVRSAGIGAATFPRDSVVVERRQEERSARALANRRAFAEVGTGCTLSAAIATLLGHGQSLEHAITLARNFVYRAIGAAPGFGAGNGPLGHQAVRSTR